MLICQVRSDIGITRKDLADDTCKGTEDIAAAMYMQYQNGI